MPTATRTRGKSDKRTAADKALKAQLETFQPADADVLDRITHFEAHYSARNALLIVLQRPDATDVAGYRAWQGRDRQVRKGEAGIRILAPAGQRNADVTEADSKVKDGDGGSVRRYFKWISVFDVTQTDPATEAVTGPSAHADCDCELCG